MKKKGFTLIELLVVISIIALLLAILMPSLAKVKEMARTLICTTRLRSCATYVNIYMEENNGSFINNKWQNPLENNWKTLLHYLWKDSPEIFMCPTTGIDKNPPYSASELEYAVYENGQYVRHTAKEYFDSYGLNFWINNPDPQEYNLSFEDFYWRNKDKTRYPHDVPVLADHTELSNGAWPSTSNIMRNQMGEDDGAANVFDPPANEDDPLYSDQNAGPGSPRYRAGADGNTQTIREFCFDRHGGYNVMGFMDGSARKVGLKEMWTLRWAKPAGWDINNIYTIAGNNGDTAACAQNWDDAAPWMSAYKEY